MTLDGNTLLVVGLIFAAFTCFIWLLSTFLFKASPKTSITFALSNFCLGTFLFFYVLRSSHPTLPVYILSDVNAVLGCLMLRRGTEDFLENKKTNLELIVIAFFATAISTYSRIYDLKSLAIISICFFSAYALMGAFKNSYTYINKNFRKSYSLVTTFPLLLMASALLFRGIRTLLFSSEIDTIDLRVENPLNTGFLIIIIIALVAFNCTSISLVISKMINQIRQLSQEDPLTKTFNRRHMNEIAEVEINKVRKNNTHLSVIILDIDHFKKVNDQYGHAAGDEALISCVEIIKKNIRSTDYIGRLGGEEFCVLLPNTNTEEAKILAERIRAEIESHTVTWEQYKIPITASFGITSFNSFHKNEWSNLLNKADIAMYQAKNNGRNCIVSS